MAQRVAGATARITHVETTRERLAPPLPFDLGALQQEAGQQADMGAQEVLDTVQSLYEAHKAVTYPRTDCRYLPVSMLAEAGSVLDAIMQSDPAFAPALAQIDRARQSKAWNDEKLTAHHAIIPTAKPCDSRRMSAAERRLYELIRTRYVVQFCPDHEADRTVLSIDIANAAFRATGKIVVVAGWKAVSRSGEPEPDRNAGDNARLPAVRKGDACQVVGAEIQAKQTRPPPHYTEGTLIAAMKNAASLVTDERLKKVLRETAGLGTEATRAGIIKTLIERGFLAKRRKQLVVTEAGRTLITLLPKSITNPETTALWEQALDEIGAGRLALDAFLARQTEWVCAALNQVRKQGLSLPTIKETAPQKACPECGQPMRERQSRHGAFWGCTGYPACQATVQADRKRRRKAASE